MSQNENKPMTFWDHLEELRGVFFRIIIAAFVGFTVAFCFKELLFKLVLAPSSPDFIFYRWIDNTVSCFGVDTGPLQDFKVELFSNTLTAQFLIHMKMAFYVSLIIILPYILYLLFGFISPGLHLHERKSTTQVVVWSYILFMLGIALNYFIIFPLAFRFLGTYQVSPDIPNVITLESYSDMLVLLTIMMGVLFEIPILAWFLAKLGLINDSIMKKYRRHAIVVILIVAAFITPTGDVFTLSVVSLPIYVLYEVSIGIVRYKVKA
ncbi:MAG: twin-arginine translocase subunit TatC [Bacteroidaceae bacterium]|nr:twin-arginine translocase subunit TatC [Bacteroidaceae bacterium]